MSTPPDPMRPWTGREEDGQTPLDPDEAQGLKLAFVATRADLNVAEAMNIIAGMKWAEARIRSGVDVAADVFLRKLHARLLGQVWTWAGKYRTTGRNIGIDPAHIAVMGTTPARCSTSSASSRPERWVPRAQRCPAA